MLIVCVRAFQITGRVMVIGRIERCSVRLFRERSLSC
jgi:hypothetical protein